MNTGTLLWILPIAVGALAMYSMHRGHHVHGQPVAGDGGHDHSDEPHEGKKSTREPGVDAAADDDVGNRRPGPTEKHSDHKHRGC